MEKIYFTLDQANALLPFLTDTLEEIRKTKKEIVELVQHIEKENLDFESIFSNKELSPQEKVIRQKFEDLGDRVNEQVQFILEKGPILKDIEQGLIDFFAKIDGEDVFLCWKFGEPEIQYWHGIHDGFSGRKSLFTRSILEDVTKVH